jgi:hypothetical protein
MFKSTSYGPGPGFLQTEQTIGHQTQRVRLDTEMRPPQGFPSGLGPGFDNRNSVRPSEIQQWQQDFSLTNLRDAL